jgi:peptidoglycan/LPS O-acetylase OafA/YrhL
MAATAVIVSHSFLLCGQTGVDPLAEATGFDMGTTAVIAFFAISGFFISSSFDHRTSDADFILARITRIVPGLLVCSLLTAFVVGPLFTALSPGQYFESRSVWLYPVQVTSVVRLPVSALPHVFPNSRSPDVNIALWTLYYEVACYAGLFVAGSLRLLHPNRFLTLPLLWTPVYLAARYGPWLHLNYYAIFSLPFLLGMIVYRYRASGILRGWVALVLAGMAVGLALEGIRIEELWDIATGYGVLWLGFSAPTALLAYNRAGDYSYGTYIYGFLVQQIIAAFLPNATPAVMILLALPLAILCGALSWYVVERPVLTLRRFARDASTQTVPRNSGWDVPALVPNRVSD